MIRIKATVVAFEEDTLHDSFEDGGFASFHESLLQISKGCATTKKELRFYHDEEIPKDSLWRKLGQPVSFLIRKEHLESDRQLFAGALSNIHEVKH